jgi:hypothetical protein
MRKLFLVSAFSAFVLACGSDSKGGGGGLSGTVGGRAFSPVEVRAIPAGTGTTPCSVPIGGAPVSVGVKAVALDVASYADACGDYASSQCRLHMGAQNVTILIAKINPLGTEPALATGTYKIFSSPATVDPDGTGLLNVGYAQALATDATCVGTPSPAVQGGTVRLDKVTDPITGHVSITFQDGSKLEGDFSAPICQGPTPDICQLATSQEICTLPPACVP